MLSARYDSEQEELTAKIKELEKILVSEPVEIDGQKIQRLTPTIQQMYDGFCGHSK